MIKKEYFMEFRTQYDKLKKVLISEKPSMTNQSSKKSCDINYIIDKYQKTGVAPVVKDKALFGDFSNVSDYQNAQNTIIKAEEQFSSLNSKIRERFNNNPSKFLEFVSNPQNKDEGIRLGIFEKEVENVVKEPSKT